MKTDIKKLEHSEVEITVTVPAEDFMLTWNPAVKKLGETTTIPGFRPGMAPNKILIDKIGEDKILLEMADQTIRDTYAKIIIDNKLDAIGAPSITLMKLAKDNPLEFKITTAIMPAISLPDYKKIAGEISPSYPIETEVTTEEIDQVIKEIQTRQQASLGQVSENKDEALPELTDDYVKTLGKFESVADFKNKITDNIKAEKEHKSREKRRLAIIEKIGDEAKPDLPPVLIEHETEKMLDEMRHQIEQMGMKFNDYLNHLKKSEAELKAAWQDDAKKRVVFGLIIHAISEDKKLIPTTEEIDAQAEILKTQFQDSEKIDISRLRSYIKNVLTNQKVMDFLDPIESKSKKD
ncbi:MAG TPA: trigger factor [Candidatus Paceibacterota bacterium]